MTIEEQITIFEHNAEHERKEGDLNNCLHFRQLAEWLKDYKRLLGAIDAIKSEIAEYLQAEGFGSEYRNDVMQIIDRHTSGGDTDAGSC